MLSRRELCAGLGALALGAACSARPGDPNLPDADAPTELTVIEHGSGLATVIEVRWREAVDARGHIDAAAVRAMLAAALARLPGLADRFAAWAASPPPPRSIPRAPWRPASGSRGSSWWGQRRNEHAGDEKHRSDWAHGPS